MRLPIPKLLFLAGLRHLLRQRSQALLALTGVTLGVAVVLAIDLANQSAREAFADSAAALRGTATHRLVGATGTLPQQLYVDLFRQPGHPPMAPVISARVVLDGIPGRPQLVGLDLFAERGFRTTLERAVDTGLSASDWLTTPGAVVVSTGAAARLGVDVGGTLTLRRRGTAQTLQVAALYPDHRLATRDLLIVDIATAQAITGLDGRLSHIDLILDDAARHWFDARLPPGVSLVDARREIDGITGMSAAFELNLTAMSLLALLVGMFLIFNAMSFTVVQRRNVLGRLRALGVTASQLQVQVLTEALVLALLGTLLGALLGLWLGQGLTVIVASTISSLYYEVTVDGVHIAAGSLVKAAVLGTGGTLLAVLAPARRAAATPPLTTLSRSALEASAARLVGSTAAFGALLATGGLLLALRVPGGVVLGFAGLFALLLGAAMATPQALQGVRRLLHLLPLPRTARMAVRDTGRHLSRLATASAALMVALAASLGVAVMIDSMRSSVDAWLGDLLAADLYVAARDDQDHAPLPPALTRLAAELPQTAAISRYRSVHVAMGGRPLRVVAAELAAPSRRGFRLLDDDGDSWARFDDGGVLVSEPLAHRTGVGTGGTLTLPTPDGPQAFRVAAVFQDYASEHGRVFMPLADYRRLWHDPDVDTLALFARAGDVAALHAAAVAQLSEVDDLIITAAAEIRTESLRIFDRTFRITEVLRYLLLLVAVIGILSALMAIQLDRRREYAVLRALGMTRAQISRLILAQSGLLGLVAGLAAVPTGLLAAWVLTDVIQLRAFGWSMRFVASPGPLLLTVMLGVLAALAAGLYPAWRSAREDPAPQLREEA